jgi:exopolysaccharide production protein ExoZ
MNKNITNLQSIQIMRGVASLLVLLNHISVKGFQYGNGALKGFEVGGAGVDLFFIISGYIMCISTWNQQLNFAQFIIRRIKRIIPLYWLVTSIALIVFLYNSKLINSSGGETSILASYTLFPNGKKYLNANGWTLSYEFFFYIIFGFFINKGTYKALQASTAILLVLITIGLCFTYNTPLLNFTTNSLLIEFVFGMGCFYFINKQNVRLNYKYAIGLIISGLLIFSLLITFEKPDYVGWKGILWGIPVILLFIGLMFLEDFIKRSTSLVKVLFLEIGNSSYSLYLIHPFTLSGTAICLKHVGLASNPYFFTMFLLAVSVAIGHLVYLYVERFLTNLMSRIPVIA